MIIDNVDALKSWLAKLLEPICDADPSALANYVVALVKKDKPEKELKALCADQLDVFLQKETTGFVDKLFECLTTKNYLESPPPKEAAKEETKVSQQKPEEKEEPDPHPHVEDDRESRRRRSPLRNRPDFNESRSRDERRRDERKRRDVERHGKGGESYRERHERWQGSSRGRSYSRSRSRSRSGSRGKSRGREHRSKFEVERKDPELYTPSPAPMGNPPPPLLSMPPPQHQFPSSGGGALPSSVTVVTPAHLPDSTTENWSSFYLNHNKSKPFRKSSSLKQRCRDYDARGFCVRGDLCPFDHGNDPLIVDDLTLPTMIPFPPPPPGMPPTRLPMPPMTEPPPNLHMPPHAHGQPPHAHGQPPHAHGQPPHAQPAHAHAQPAHAHGQPPHAHAQPPHAHGQPPHAHGQPPHAQPPHAHGPPPHAHGPPPHAHGQPPPPGIFPMPGAMLIPASGNENPSLSGSTSALAPPGVGHPPPPPAPPAPPAPPTPSSSSSSLPLHPQYSVSEYPYDLEAYNPEAPALTGLSRQQYRHFIPRIQTQRSNLIGLTAGDCQGSRAANIVIQTEPSVTITSTIESQFGKEVESRKRTLNSIDCPQAKKSLIEKPNFNNQHKPNFPKKNHYVNTKLEVRKIPRELNNITKLNEHFCKFGTIVNIQVVFGGDPEAALIQYTSNEEARRAISSIQAVLDNRFIRVYWHREPSGQTQDQGSAPNASLPTEHPATHKVINKLHSPGAYVLNKTIPKPRPGISSPPTTSTEHLNSSLSPSPEASAVTFQAGSLSLQKGTFSRTVLKPASKSLGRTAKLLEAQEVLKKKQEAMKLQQDMRKKKQEMLQKQIEWQKVLINRLEKTRTMKPEERANIMKTLKELTEKISQLQTEISPAAHSNANNSQAKTKTDAQKELLDAELDFHKKLNSGEDTTDLKRRLGQLQVEATRLGLIPPVRVKAAPPRGRGRGRGRSLRGRGGASHMVVDHRPRALIILGITQEEKEELMPHFVKFGEIEELRDQDASSVVMTFKTRSEAENAANQGAKFKGRILQISWYKPKTASVSMEPEEESKEEVRTEAISPFLLPEEEEEDDDDEDEEDESRSWRR
ncbi:RNA-binding protein 27 [Denticeps clupeoides]|uniref:RNA-binding protein 27 n=1 Tax=Denticeps clupeoides TaxID=299321 RepID=UPI0010A339EC|nr:RNA-binding protein 27 [Denticeps clupeoides]